VHNRVAKEQTQRLNKLNGSMFIPTGLSKKKLAELDERTRQSEIEEMRARDEARAGAYAGRTRMDGVMQDLQRPQQLGASRANKSRREEFKFEDDDGEQEALNDEIDNITDQLAAGVSMLNGAARVINAELEDQIRQVDRITEKVRFHTTSLSARWLTIDAERAGSRPGPEEPREPRAGSEDEVIRFRASVQYLIRMMDHWALFPFSRSHLHVRL